MVVHVMVMPFILAWDRARRRGDVTSYSPWVRILKR